MQTLWLYLYFPTLQLDSLLKQQPESKHLPVVVLDEVHHRIIQTNAMAQQAGIQTGMNLGTAAALSHSLQTVVYDSSIEASRLLDIAENLYLVTADIGLQKPNCLLLRVHTMLHLYGDLATYWQTVKNQLDEFEFCYQFATGHSPLAAKLLAYSGLNKVTDKTQYLKQTLSQITLAHTDLDTKTQHKLNRVGVHTLGALLDVPLADIAKRFDLELVNYLGRVSGELKHPVEFFHPTRLFERGIELFYDIQNSQTLLHPLNYLLKRLEQFLLIRDEVTFTLIITLLQREKPQIIVEVGAQQGEYQASVWSGLLALKLESVTLQAPVYAVRLKTGPTQIHHPDSPDLFSAKQQTLSRLQLSALLQAKLGNDALHSAWVNNDFRPQIAAAYHTPFSHPSTPSSSLQANRPILLYEQAKPLQEAVSIIQGPERIQTGWWDANPIQRDYFIARSAHGIWYWVFRTPDMKWFLHGLFS